MKTKVVGRGWQALLTILLWGSSWMGAVAQPDVGGSVRLGTASMLKDVQAITDYYEQVRARMDDGEGGRRVPASGVNRPAESAAGARLGYRAGQRDPFSVTDSLLRPDAGTGPGARFQPKRGEQIAPGKEITPGMGKIPRMKLRGLVTDGNGDLAALLEIEKSGIHIVREGDTVGLYERGDDAVIRVVRIGRLNLLVEIGSLGQVIIVR